jgi:DNA invertase Pin-like site-specific DNA recombinase
MARNLMSEQQRQRLRLAAKAAAESGESEGRLVGEFIVELLDENDVTRPLVRSSLDNIIEWAQALRKGV